MKVFGRWGMEGIQVTDPGLKGYINLRPMLVPRSSGRNTSKRFHKNRVNIVERLMNKLMGPGHKGKKHYISSGNCGGKSLTAYKIVEKTLEILQKKTNKNPFEVLVTAIQNAAPREEITTIEYGGARYPQAVDCAPQRRVDLVLRMFTQGAFQKSFGKNKHVWDALADEIFKAYEISNQSVAIAKKLELERMADAAR